MTALCLRRLFLFLGACLLAGCATHRPLSHNRALPAAPRPQPPVLVNEQLLGLQKPPDLAQDLDSGQRAQSVVLENYHKLKEKAAQDGWHLILVSGYRSFYHQRQIWNHYDTLYKKSDDLDERGRVKAIMSLVTVPGLSRHHWGTDLDISESSLRGQLVNVHPDTPKRVVDFYLWMERNAPTFGFCKVYLGNRGAVRHEPWHWSYFPFAQVYERQFLAITDFHRILNDRVANVHYLMRNFPKILGQETRSINEGCAASVAEAAPGSANAPDGKE